MFKVNDVNKSTNIGKQRAVGKTGSGEDFAQYLNIGQSARMQDVKATAAVASADAIFAAQMVDDEEKKQIREKMIKKGYDLLDKLDEIRQGLLQGEIAKERLIEISRFVKSSNFDTADERLREILSEIELRVEVEIEKIRRNYI
ncbi:MAG: flagellar assembly protein FliX [Alphaproteobacteria bacterium]|nr:flagellar assembly protein FliX [Alphaproteobacteria bacterium]